MTENEAISELKMIKHTRVFLPSDEVWKMAIQALEEIQQYRAIGTVEELKKAKEVYNEILLSERKINVPKECIAYEVGKLREKELRQYKAIGTVEKIKEELDRLRNDNECQGLYFTLEERKALAKQSTELSEYKDIGTIEDFKALKEKSVANKQVSVVGGCIYNNVERDWDFCK